MKTIVDPDQLSFDPNGATWFSKECINFFESFAHSAFIRSNRAVPFF